MSSSGAPSYAYVKYFDGAKAIVHLSLIREYTPSSLSDLAKKKDVYWGGGKEEEEGFYSAQVMELGVTKADLIRRLARRKIPVPDFDFEESEPVATVSQENAVSAKDAANNVKTAKRQKLQELMDGSSSDDDVLPKKLLEERRKNATLLRRLKQVRKEKAELQARHDRVEDIFLNKFESWLAARCHLCLKEHSSCTCRTERSGASPLQQVRECSPYSELTAPLAAATTLQPSPLGDFKNMEASKSTGLVMPQNLGALAESSGQASTSMAPGPLQNHPGGVLGVSGQASTSMAPAPLQDHPGALVEVSGQVLWLLMFRTVFESLKCF
ncbi:uncharacterized protein LOC144119061 [Amblyomma americanum]